MSLGSMITQLRKQKDLTQGELAELIDVHQSMVARWEKDQAHPRPSTLEKLAQALNIRVEELAISNYGKLGATLDNVEDADLLELFGQVHKLESRDKEALKAVLEAMLTRTRVQEAISMKKGA